MNTNEWVPSHVQITINQARELLLKNKSSSSELYVVVHTEKEKFATTPVLRSTEPEWNFTSEIPLMSLDTTLHITVRQKGRLSDEFIGYIAIPLSGFKLSSKQVTHWYKLGSRPGKQNVKLRGDLQITLQLLSNWVLTDTLDTAVTSSSRKVYPVSKKSVLKRSRSEIRRTKSPERSSSLSLSNEGPLSEKTNNPTSKVKEKMSAFRRSFRKKNKSPVLQDCEDDFTYTPPMNHRVRSNTIDVSSFAADISKATPGTSLSDVSSLDSDGSVVKPSVSELFAVAAALEEEEKQVMDGEMRPEDVTMSPAARYHSLRNRSRKTRWSMHTLPVTTPSPGSTPIEHMAETPCSLDEGTYRAKSHSLAHSPKISRNRAKSLCVDDNHQSSLSAQSLYGSAGEVDVTGYSPEAKRKQDPESGYSTSSSTHKIKHCTISEEECEATTKKPSKKLPTQSESSLSKPASPSPRRTVTSPTARSKPTSKGSVSPTPAKKQRPRVLSTNSANVSLKRAPSKPRGSHPSSSNATPNRSPSLSRTPSDSRTSSGARTPSGSRPLSKGTRTASLREKAPIKKRPRSMIDNSSKPRQVTESKTVQPGSVAAKSKPRDMHSGTCTLSPSPDAKQELDSEPLSPTDVPSSATATDKMDANTQDKTPSHCKREEARNLSPTNHSIASERLSEEPEQLNDEAFSELNDKPVESTPTVQKSPDSTQETVSSSKNDESLSADSDASSSTAVDDKKPKHTVAYNEDFQDGFKPVSLLPPSLMSYKSQTLPSRSKLRRHASDNNFVIPDTLKNDRPSTISTSQEAFALNRKSVTLRHPNRSPENVMHRRSVNLALLSAYNKELLDSIPQSPPRQINSLEDINREESISRLSTTSTLSQDSESRPSTPATPNSVRYSGKTPGEIVTSALRNRKPTGGLRKAINMYQENRKLQRDTQQTSRKTQPSLQVAEECLDRSTSSAESSPQTVRRNRSAASAFSVLKNPFSSLRRTKSLNPSTMTRPSSIADLDATDGDPLPDLQPPPLKVPANSLSSINQAEQPVETGSEEVDSKTVSETSSKSDLTSRGTREDTPTLTDTSSIKTLTEAECNQLSVRRTSSPNPAGAITSNHIRHTTCSSIGSEGIGSYTSEELSLEDLAHQDWSHWTKEELVKELIHSKQRLKTTEDDLKDTKNYLDNLLLRIMETNPSILSSVRSS